MIDKPKFFTSAHGTQIEYLVRDNESSVTVFWFSAFTQGPRLGRLLKSAPKFHGYKVSQENTEFNWVLIRDHAGFTNDGTYYGGKAGNLFIEDSVVELIFTLQSEFRRKNYDARFVAMGSSMGGYAAVKFSLLCGIDACFVYSPHFDMKIAMQFCGRKRWIQWSLDSGTEKDKEDYVNRLQNVVAKSSDSLRNTKLLVQATADDPYVYPEQIVPFIKRFEMYGGSVHLDLRSDGGHTSIYTPNEYIYFVLQELGSGRLPKQEMLETFPQRSYSLEEKIENHLQKFEHLLMKVLKFFHIR